MSNELALNDREKRRFKSLEDGIRNSGKIMYESMRAIHDERLYRDEFKTWEEYCADRWKMGKAYAYRLIEHGKVLALMNSESDLSPMGDIPERATRELSGLPDEKKVEVIKEVAAKAPSTKSGTKRITVAAVKAEAQKHRREPGDESEPEGESPVIPSSSQAKTQQQKTVKTAEALTRAFDDLHAMSPGSQHSDAVSGCKRLLKIAKEWA